MTIKRMHVAVNCSDLEASLSFYRLEEIKHATSPCCMLGTRSPRLTAGIYLAQA